MGQATVPQETEIPCTIPSEKALLGILVEDDALLPSILATGLTADHFMLSDHQQVFRAILDLCEQSAPINSISVAEALGGRRRTSC